jgi:serine/threonine protein kinase
MEGKLGEGGFGNVFLAKHKQTGEKFAIKIIKT